MVGPLVVIALGGNALAKSNEKLNCPNQMANSKHTAAQIKKLLESGYRVAIAHGNGPQVGAIIVQNQAGAKVANIPEMPMYMCGAESQGEIGFMLQNTMKNELLTSGKPELVEKSVCCIITQTEVDPKDPAFQNPTKPVGTFLTEEEMMKAKEEDPAKAFVHDKVRGGYRVVVPSPIPTNIVEIEAIKAMVGMGAIVIAAGGGGIPVMKKEDGSFHGIDAVIDKDRASSLMARQLNADHFVILTDVEYAYTNFQDKEKRQCLKNITLAEARDHIKKGEFSAGSMLPKIEAACDFVEKTGKTAVISSLDHVLDAVAGISGTSIRFN